MRKIFLFLGGLAISIAAWAQSDARPEILVLGTYHMANRGRDVFNLQADDVLSPKRQGEMAQLIEVLKRFHPTKIAIEANLENQQVGREYSDYVAGKYTLSRDETNQLGYRLAKELGHHAVYPVNVEGEFPIQRVANYAKANGRAGKLDSMTAKNMALYYASVPFGEPDDYAGPDLLALWYQRNIRIYHNIITLVESPNDRILVIYGAGHLAWLQQDIVNDATVRLRKLNDLTEKQ